MSSSIERDIKAITQLDVHIKSKNFTDYLPRFIRRRADENTREKRGLGMATGLICLYIQPFWVSYIESPLQLIRLLQRGLFETGFLII